MRGKYTMIVLAAVLLATTGGCGTEEEAATPKTTASEEPAVVAVGETVAVDSLSLRVDGVEKSKELVTSGGTRYEPNGVFVLVKLVFAHERQEAMRVSDANVTLLGGNGETYRIDRQGQRAFASAANLKTEWDPKKTDVLYGFVEVPPGAPREAVAVFDVPDEAVTDARLEFALGGSRTRIELGI